MTEQRAVPPPPPLCAGGAQRELDSDDTEAAWRSSGFPLPQRGFDLESACYGRKMAAARQDTSLQPTVTSAVRQPTTPDSQDTNSDDPEPPTTVVRRSYTFADFFDKELLAARRERIKSELEINCCIVPGSFAHIPHKSNSNPEISFYYSRFTKFHGRRTLIWHWSLPRQCCLGQPPTLALVLNQQHPTHLLRFGPRC